MRFLKNKLAQARLARAVKTANLHDQERTLLSNNFKIKKSEAFENNQALRRIKRKEISNIESISGGPLATKNIVKNFGKAICTFISSKIAFPYLSEFAARTGSKIEGFIHYVKEIKHKIIGLHQFREILLAFKTDSEELTANKAMFKYLSQIFIQFFSVNWIFNSKIVYKDAHLKYRFKMLRRIQNPELFTYLKTSKNGTKKRNT